MAEPAREEPRYRAFLSYSHRDAAAAAWIHRRLESYRVPKRLVGRETERGPVPHRLCPIFRDREEMAASADLSEAVRAGLAESGALIVLCSPAAAESHWVAEEIRTFRALHPGAPVLAAIVAGEPPACFPEPLLAAPDGARTEPLATDLKRDGDGQHLGLLKLVAGVTGIPLDGLVQRDASRRIRRVTAVTAAALVAVLMMAALTVFALDARREAERQRAEAEGLIEFMLTDLRDKLKGVGRLDVLGAVNARALRYYRGSRDLADLPAESLARRARIIHAIGHDHLERRNLAAAFTSFRDARATTGELVRRSRDDASRIAEHATSEFGLGRVYELRRQWRGATLHYRAFAAAAARLVAIDPENPDFMLKAASGAINLGNVDFDGTKDYRAARRHYEAAVHWLDRAARARPGDLHILFSQANAYGWLADSYYLADCWQESLEARLRQYSIMTRLRSSDPESAAIAFRLAAARRGLAHSHHQLGDRSAASEYLVQADRAVQTLVAHDPENAEWRSLRSTIRRDLQGMPVRRPAAAAGACRRSRPTAAAAARPQLGLAGRRNNHRRAPTPEEARHGHTPR